MGMLIVTWNFPPRRGGIETLMAEIAAGLKRRHPVFVITAYAKSVSDQDGVFRTPCPGLLPFAFYTLWRGAVLLAKEAHVEVVFGGSAMVAPLVFFLARLFRRRAIVQAHGLDLVYGSLVYQKLCVSWLKRCDRIVANSAYTATLAVARGVSRESVSVIPLGVDTARFAPALNCEPFKEEFGVKERSIILFVGRLARRKGIREFIGNCLPAIVREAPEACLIVAGGNPTEALVHRGDIRAEIEMEVRKLGLGDHARILGEVSDENLVKLYQCCDVFVLPALEMADDVEGFGLVLLEAEAAGKPVVATRVGGIPNAVDHGENGILTEPGDYRTLSAAIIALLHDKERRRAMGRCARQRVQNEYSWEAIVARYEAMLDSHWATSDRT